MEKDKEHDPLKPKLGRPKKKAPDSRGVKAGTKRGKYVIKPKKRGDEGLTFIEKVKFRNKYSEDEVKDALYPKRATTPRKELEKEPEPIQVEQVDVPKRGNGRPKGRLNRSTVVRAILEATRWGKDPITGIESYIPIEYQMTLAILQKALKGDVNAYKALMDNAYKPHAQEVESKNVTVDISNFSEEDIKALLNDDDDDDDEPDYFREQELALGEGAEDSNEGRSEESTGIPS
jgi:hypothetical protein